MLRDPRRYQKRTKRPAGEGWRGARSEGVGRRREGERTNEGEAAGKMGREGDEYERNSRRVRVEWERPWRDKEKKERPRETEREELIQLIYPDERKKERGKDKRD